MITMEKKLSMFTKLIYERLQSETKKELEELKKKNEDELVKKIEAFNKKKLDTINGYTEDGENKKSSIISKANLESKKEILKQKNAYLESIVERLKERLEEFASEDGYETFMKKRVEEAVDEIGKENLEIHVVDRDMKILKKIIDEELDGAEIIKKTMEGSLIGGIIAFDAKRGIRYDMSLKSELEDRRDQIGIRIESFFKKAGGHGGI